MRKCVCALDVRPSIDDDTGKRHDQCAPVDREEEERITISFPSSQHMHRACASRGGKDLVARQAFDPRAPL